jgi:hypothetical protein
MRLPITNWLSPLALEWETGRIEEFEDNIGMLIFSVETSFLGEYLSVNYGQREE